MRKSYAGQTHWPVPVWYEFLLKGICNHTTDICILIVIIPCNIFKLSAKKILFKYNKTYFCRKENPRKIPTKIDLLEVILEVILLQLFFFFFFKNEELLIYCKRTVLLARKFWYILNFLSNYVLKHVPMWPE